MSNFDRAIKTLNDVDEAIDHLADNDAYVAALEAAGLLMSDVRIIRTVEELEALDPDSLLITVRESILTPRIALDWIEFSGLVYLPAAVIATGDQVRAAREAMEQEHG